MNKETLKRVMGENIRRERLARNLSIDELADLLTKTTGFIGLLERGLRGVTAYNCHKLSEVFDISLDELFAQHPSTSLELREDSTDNLKLKRLKVNSLITDLGESELDFLTAMIKELKKIDQDPHQRTSDDSGELDDLE